MYSQLSPHLLRLHICKQAIQLWHYQFQLWSHIRAGLWIFGLIKSRNSQEKPPPSDSAIDCSVNSGISLRIFTSPFTMWTGHSHVPKVYCMACYVLLGHIFWNIRFCYEMPTKEFEAKLLPFYHFFQSQILLLYLD